MINTLDSFFESVSWPMEPFASYGVFHILYTLIGFAVCGLFATAFYMIEYLGFFETSRFFATDSPLMGNTWNTLVRYLKPVLDKFIG